MQISREDIIFIITVLAATFLIAGFFVLSFITLYNKRKKRDFLQKLAMQKDFEHELVKAQMEVQEQTLTTIASDIHDNVGQLLSIAKLTLSSIQTDDLTDKNVRKLSGAKEMLDNAAAELRQMASLLHAENVLAEGIAHAIEREVGWLLKSERLRIHYSTEGMPYQLPQQTALIAYRITQEILNNTIKHAQATEVVVNLSFHVSSVDIFISDNGKGFQPDQQKGNGLGMKTLFHRAGMIGADLRVESGEGKGTKATLHIPLQTHRSYAKNAG